MFNKYQIKKLRSVGISIRQNTRSFNYLMEVPTGTKVESNDLTGILTIENQGSLEVKKFKITLGRKYHSRLTVTCQSEKGVLESHEKPTVGNCWTTIIDENCVIPKHVYEKTGLYDFKKLSDKIGRPEGPKFVTI